MNPPPPGPPGPAAPLHGLWRTVPSPALTEICALGGFHFQILDCEHGGYDYATLLADVMACERHGCRPLVRVGGADRIQVQRCLDLGARGIVFPQLATVEDFTRAAAMMDYAPAGTRGYNPFVRAADYGSRRAGAPAAGRPWCVPIVETLAAVEQIEAIVRLDRIDLVYVGVYDLSAQLGCPGVLNTPELAQRLDRIVAACRGAAKPVAMMALSAEAARRLAARGVQALVHGVESHRLAESMSDFLAPLLDLRLPAGAAGLASH